MANDDDDIEKLLAEIDAMDNAKPSSSQPAKPPAKRQKAEVEKSEDDDSGVGRVGWALIAGGGAGILGFLIGTFFWVLPGVNGWSTGIGAFVGGAIVALLSGPPKWLS